MSQDRDKRRAGRKDLQGIIELCRSVQTRSLNPFLVNVDDLLEVLRRYFPEWEGPEDLCLDAEALNEIASVIKLQSEWVKRRSSSLYTDPFILEEKIRRLNADKLTEIFLLSWHPIAEIEQLSPKCLEEALAYWESLLPINERLRREVSQELKPRRISREELVKLGLLAEEAFQEELTTLWNELKEKVGVNGKINYWDFITANSYKETIKRAYIMSFLVTYGYVAMEVHPLKEEILLTPLRQPRFSEERAGGKSGGVKKPASLPIPIGYEEWLNWRRKKFLEGRGEGGEPTTQG